MKTFMKIIVVSALLGLSMADTVTSLHYLHGTSLNQLKTFIDRNPPFFNRTLRNLITNPNCVLFVFPKVVENDLNENAGKKYAVGFFMDKESTDPATIRVKSEYIVILQNITNNLDELLKHINNCRAANPAEKLKCWDNSAAAISDFLSKIEPTFRVGYEAILAEIAYNNDINHEYFNMFANRYKEAIFKQALAANPDVLSEYAEVAVSVSDNFSSRVAEALPTSVSREELEKTRIASESALTRSFPVDTLDTDSSGGQLIRVERKMYYNERTREVFPLLFIQKETDGESVAERPQEIQILQQDRPLHPGPF